MTLQFPQRPLDVSFRLFLKGQWVEFGPTRYVVDDFYTDEYTDEYLGRFALNVNRLPAQEIVVERGALDEASGQEPASASVLLWNLDGALTSGNPDSPFWPDVGVGTRAQLRIEGHVVLDGDVSSVLATWPFGDLSVGEVATWDGETWTWDGEPVTWATGDEHPGECFVQITVAGDMRRLRQPHRPDPSPLRQLVVQPSNLPYVSDYWPMEDGSDAVRLLSGLPESTRPHSMAFNGDLQLAADETMPGSSPLPMFSEGSSGVWASFVRGSAGYSAGWVVEKVVRFGQLPKTPHERWVMFDVDTDGTLNRWAVELGYEAGITTPYLRVWWHDPAVGVVTSTADAAGIVPNRWYQFRLEVTPSEWQLLFRDIADTDALAAGFGDTVTGDPGVPTLVRGSVYQAPVGGYAFGHLVVHSTARNVSWLRHADAGWIKETALGRIRRVCGAKGIPLSWTKDEAGGDLPGDVSGLGETQQLGRQRALPTWEILDEAAQSDAGLLCERRSARGLRYRTLASLCNQTPRMVIDAKRDGLVNPFERVTDDFDGTNDVTVNRIDGGTANRTDDESIARHGLRERSYDLSVNTEVGLRHHAGWRLNTGRIEDVRFPKIGVDFCTIADQDRLTELMTTFLRDMGPGDRIQVTGLPPQVPQELADQIALGWIERYQAHAASVEFNGAPYRPYLVATWDESRWHPEDASLRDAVDVDDTTLTVASSDEWTTDAGEFPFDVLIGGAERASVVEIAASGSDWVFSVVRGVNGRARAWPAGTSVDLYDPALLLL